MAETEKTSPTPPYLAYTTFFNKVKELGGEDGQPPAQIDPSLLHKMSGTAQKQFMAALKFFGLIDAGGVPQQGFYDFLAASDDEERKTFVRHWVEQKYAPQVPLLRDGSPKQLRESFDSGLNGATLESAVRFLLAASRDVGIPVSPHHKKTSTRKPRSQRSNGGKPRGKAANAGSESDIGGGGGGQHKSMSYEMALLEKFPEFDPSWNEDQKTAWFQAYQKLLSMAQTDPSKKTNDDS